MKKIGKWLLCFTMCLLSVLGSNGAIQAEGSKQLTSDGDNPNGGYRPYTERYGATTAGIEREQRIYVYAKAGETLYFGSSVYDANNPKYGDIHVSGVTMDSFRSEKEEAIPFTGDFKAGYDVTKEGTGYIDSREKEVAGPIHDGKSKGYTPLHFKAPAEGVYIFRFYSTGLSTDNPALARVQDLKTGTAINTQQKKGTVAAWDVTVANPAGTEILGRSWTYVLCLNMGQNTRANNTLNSTVYVLTDDGYTYETDFNGMDPYGFIFFANNRGLIDTTSDTSLYKSVKDPKGDNGMNHLKDSNVGFHDPQSADTEVDKTHKIFFTAPASDLPTTLKKVVATPTVENFEFVSSHALDATTGLVGTGGYFYIKGKNLSSFELNLDFSNRKDDTGTVVDSSTLTPKTIHATFNKNTNKGDEWTKVYWDGTDGKGNIVPWGTYDSTVDKPFAQIVPKGGEFHFPMLDVENNKDGVRIKNTDTNDDTVYYDNTGVDTLKKETNPDGRGGVNSNDGASKFSNQHGDTVAVDLWAYTKYDAKTYPTVSAINLDDGTAITVEKIWGDGNNNDATRPDSITVQLMRDGVIAPNVAGDPTTIVLNKENGWKHSWNRTAGDSNPYTYSVKETKIGDEDVIDHKTSNYEVVEDASDITCKVDIKAGTSSSANSSKAACIPAIVRTKITNTHQAQTTSAKVVKFWDDHEDADGVRPDEVKVALMMNGTIPFLNQDGEYVQVVLHADNGWQTQVDDLPLYNNGKKIDYEFVEVEEEGNTKKDVYTATSNVDKTTNTTTITNTHEWQKTSLTLEKIWDDKENQYNTRSDSLDIRLYADGVLLQDVKLTAKEQWKGEIKDLPKCKKGTEIDYEFKEEQVPDNYHASRKESGTDTKLTNTLDENYTPSETPKDPTKPNESEKPGKPNEPVGPKDPSTSKDPVKHTGVSTGDTSIPMVVYAMLAVSAIAAIGRLLVWKRKNKAA